MPTRQLSNTLGVWGETAQASDPVIQYHKTTVALQHGDVVIADTTNIGQVTSTTSAASVLVQGVVCATGDSSTNATTYAANSVVPIAVSGVVRVNIGALTVAASGVLNTSTTAKAADDGLATQLGNSLGVALESQAAKDANNCIRALIKIA